MRGTPYERVMAKTRRERDCLVFTGKKWLGYGRIWDSTRDGGPLDLAHRVVWAHHNGPIPEGMFICHHCDNRACVELSHLFVGTHQDNVADMMSKGRQRRGEWNGGARLTPVQVLAIRRERKCGALQQALADRYGVGRTTVRRIISGTTWKHI